MSRQNKELIREIDQTFYSLMRYTKQQIIKESVDGSTISPPQFGVLNCLERHGKRTMSELSSQMNLSHGAMTGLVDRLFKLDLIERVRSEKDRRVVYVSISDKGASLIKTLEAKRHKSLEQIVEQLSNEEQSTVLKALILIKEKLMKDVETP